MNAYVSDYVVFRICIFSICSLKSVIMGLSLGRYIILPLRLHGFRLHIEDAPSTFDTDSVCPNFIYLFIFYSVLRHLLGSFDSSVILSSLSCIHLVCVEAESSC